MTIIEQLMLDVIAQWVIRQGERLPADKSGGRLSQTEDTLRALLHEARKQWGIPRPSAGDPEFGFSQEYIDAGLPARDSGLMVIAAAQRLQASRDHARSDQAAGAEPQAPDPAA